MLVPLSLTPAATFPYPSLKHCCNSKTEAVQDSPQSTETMDIRNPSPAVTEGLLCVVASNPSLLSNLILAVREGRSLLVEDIGTNIDPVLDPVLCHRTFLKVGPSRSFRTRQRQLVPRATTRQPLVLVLCHCVTSVYDEL